MSLPPWKRWLALLGLVLSACASPAPARVDDAGDREDVDAVASWEEARADPSCVVPLCDEERCALWRCQDVVEVEAHPVLLAFANGSLRPRPIPRAGGDVRWRSQGAGKPSSRFPGTTGTSAASTRPGCSSPRASAPGSRSRSTTSSRRRWPRGSSASPSTFTPSPFGCPGASTSGCTVAVREVANGMRHGISSSERTLTRPSRRSGASRASSCRVFG